MPILVKYRDYFISIIILGLIIHILFQQRPHLNALTEILSPPPRPLIRNLFHQTLSSIISLNYFIISMINAGISLIYPTHMNVYQLLISYSPIIMAVQILRPFVNVYETDKMNTVSKCISGVY